MNLKILLSEAEKRIFSSKGHHFVAYILNIIVFISYISILNKLSSNIHIAITGSPHLTSYSLNDSSELRPTCDKSKIYKYPF